MWIRSGWGYFLALLAGVCVVHQAAAAEPASWDGTIVQFGDMHEAIGKRQHQGRVQLQQLLERPHFFGVAALAGLEGEVTILDGHITLTGVGDGRRLEPVAQPPRTAQATLLVGAYVPAWREQQIAQAVAPDDVDAFLGGGPSKAGLAVDKPFVFVVKGDFTQVRIHVINGACPMHARMRKIELPPELQPLELEFEKISGTLVGVFAKDAVGKITHPATSTHMHLVFQDARTGATVTGHVEQIALAPQGVLRLPR